MRTAIYPGTFDPITLGHVDVIQKSLKLFDKIVVAATNTKNKNCFFQIDKRIEIIKKSLFSDLKFNKKKISVISFNTLTINLCKKYNSSVIVSPGQKFVFSLFDSNEIWIADFSQAEMKLTKFSDIGAYPYDGLISPDGRYYIAGLFGEDGLALLDLWHTEQGVRRILPNYGKGDAKLPVYKMPHLEGWAMAGDYAFLPAVGKHSVLVVDTKTWLQVAEIPAHSQPIFVMAQPDNRQIWVNFAFPDNNTIQVFNTETFALVKNLTPGPAVLHMEFTPRGENVWISVRDSNEVHVYDTATQTLIDKLSVKSPSGIFFTSRAHQIGL